MKRVDSRNPIRTTILQGYVPIPVDMPTNQQERHSSQPWPAEKMVEYYFFCWESSFNINILTILSADIVGYLGRKLEYHLQYAQTSCSLHQLFEHPNLQSIGMLIYPSSELPPLCELDIQLWLSWDRLGPVVFLTTINWTHGSNYMSNHMDVHHRLSFLTKVYGERLVGLVNRHND